MRNAPMVLMLVADTLLVQRYRISQSSAAYEHLGRVWRRRIGAHRHTWSLMVSP